VFNRTHWTRICIHQTNHGHASVRRGDRHARLDEGLDGNAARGHLPSAWVGNRWRQQLPASAATTAVGQLPGRLLGAQGIIRK